MKFNLYCLGCADRVEDFIMIPSSRCILLIFLDYAGADALRLLRFREHLFPDADTPSRLFNGVPYKELHIVNIKSTPNNTIMSLTNFNGDVLSLHTAGIEGFKNAKKGTNLAAQQAAITFGNVSIYGMYTFICVKVSHMFKT